MYELVHRYVPDSPSVRVGVAVLASAVGLWVLAFGLLEGTPVLAVALLYLAVIAASFGIAGQLTRGLVRQANAAPTAGAPIEGDPDDGAETPIETLRRRYAEGELGQEAFQRRLDDLLETEAVESASAERERAVE
ncbi:SHOCT domain-containing protein [Halorarum halobium]|uniref:SHOCT domain-containing protein n=1 Tax=Halorarum halobium TaxID=3075121 RepID=UPI0028AC35F7|nr:SHOCT domain-containing protein [Halobaculum sp. XH14]